MNDRNLKRRLAAIVVLDIVGYSQLVGTDELGTVVAVHQRWEKVLKPLVTENGGTVVKFMGDGALVEFPSAIDAIRTALSLQQRMSDLNSDTPDAPPIRLRIGINLGDIISQDNDIFGDDVNIAARLEALSKPGEMCVSQSVYEAVRGRVQFAGEDLGEVDLKNIRRKVRAFRIHAGAANDLTSPYDITHDDHGLSIAVLPFENMSGVPEQDYIGEGIAENILTDLARFRDLTVIARNSSFAYKGKATRVQDIRRDLRVNYVLEGSVQKAGDRIRVAAQLIDAGSGGHVWAERYDRRADDLFAVMDDITELIIGVLATTKGGRLRKAAANHGANAGPRSFRAFECFVQGMTELNKYTEESVRTGLELFEEAVRLNPGYAKAHAKACWAHLLNIIFYWAADESASRKMAYEAANHALTADDSESWSHWAMAGCDLYSGHHDRAIEGMRRAVELNPNDADVLADAGLFLSYVGRAEEGLSFALKANRVNPHHPEVYDDQLGQIYFSAKQYDNAIRTFENVRGEGRLGMLVYLAASYAAVGKLEKARSVVKKLLASAPGGTVVQWTAANFVPYADSSDVEHLAENLRLAGLPG